MGELTEIGQGYTVEEYMTSGEPRVMISHHQRIVETLPASKKDRLYNSIVDFESEVLSIRFKNGQFLVEGAVYVEEKGYQIDMSPGVSLKIGGLRLPLVLHRAEKRESLKKTYSQWRFQAAIRPEELYQDFERASVEVVYEDGQGFGLRKPLKWRFPVPGQETGVSFRTRYKTSRAAEIFDGFIVFFRQTKKNNVYVYCRKRIVTDRSAEKLKLSIAYVLARIARRLTTRDVILLYEKKCKKYEEGASIFYEKMMDAYQPGMKKPYFILDAASEHMERVPGKYRANLLKQYSFRHYFLFFFAGLFMGTEQPSSALEKDCNHPFVRAKINNSEFEFIFLQHGVYYMYGLDKSISFMYKGKDFPRYGKIVCSSETEAKHFLDYAGFDKEDLLITGIPKFDRSERSEKHDKIVIMPTYRKWEINEYDREPEQTTYYRFVKNILSQVPGELRDRTIVIPHPLALGKFDETDIGQYIPENFVYDDILRETELLITDWSSIAYDAFYRGAKVLFCWEDKEECIGRFGTRLMLNEENTFADISYQFTDLQELIRKNYYEGQTAENIEKFHDIVAFHDGRNSERLFEKLDQLGYLRQKKKTDLSSYHVTGITKKLHTGAPLRLNNLEVSNGQKNLVKNVDYTVKYHDNIKPGDAKVTITGIGKYRGKIERAFLIRNNARTEFEITGIENKSYTGLPVEQNIQCIFQGERLKKGRDYTVRYENNLEKGIATVRVLGRSERFGGEYKTYFMID